MQNAEAVPHLRVDCSLQQDTTIPLVHREHNAAGDPTEKFCWVFFLLFLRDGFVKAGQTKLGAIWLVTSMNFGFLPLPCYV